MRRLSAVVCLGLVLIAMPAVAQEEAPAESLTAIAHFKVASPQIEGFADWMHSTYGDTLAGLQEAGTVLAWGVAAPLLHADMDTTVSAYFSVPNYAALEATFTALEARDAEMSEEEMGAMEEMASGMDMDAHHDELVRHVRIAPGEDPDAGKYIVLSTHAAAPGSDQKVLALFDRLVAPVYAGLKEDGHVLAYGLYVPELHMGETATHTGWVVLADLAGMDAVSAAFEAAEASWTEDDYQQFAAIFDRSAHRDVVLRIHRPDGDD